MIDIIPIQLAVEDSLSETILRTILRQTGRQFEIGTCYSRHGYGYLKKSIRGFNNAAKGIPFLVLTDLNSYECAPLLIRDWLSIPANANLIFRIAEKEVESWMIADRQAIASFLGVSESLFPIQPDEISDPKQTLINAASRSRKRELRLAITPDLGSTAKIGPDYNGTLARFIFQYWDANRAILLSPSLKRAWDRLIEFYPNYPKREA
jgi:hypothetical protein